MKAALSGLSVADAFITAVTPNFSKGDRDVEKYYPTRTAYLYAFADAMHEEYKAITDAGFILQLDRALDSARMAPWSRWTRASRSSITPCAAFPRTRSAITTAGAATIVPTPTDVPAARDHPADAQDQGAGVRRRSGQPAPRARVDGLEGRQAARGKILIPGFISQSTNVVEHPELIAWRIQNFASVVGKENVIAGVDCGFSQYWDQIRVTRASSGPSSRRWLRALL